MPALTLKPKKSKVPPPYVKTGPKPGTRKPRVEVITDLVPVGNKLKGTKLAVPTPQELDRAVRNKKILKLRIAGYSISDISEKVLLSEAGVREVLKEIYSTTLTQIQEDAEEARKLERERLDLLQKKAMERIDVEEIHIDPVTGERRIVESIDTKGIETALKISESRRKLDGLDAEEKFRVHHSGGIRREYVGVSLEEL